MKGQDISLREGGLSFVGLIASAGVSLAGSIVVARLVDPAQRGRYAAIVVTGTLLVTLLELGGELGVIRVHSEQVEYASAFVASYLLWSVIAGLGVALLAPTVAPHVFASVHAGSLAWAAAGAAVTAGLMGRLASGMLVYRNKLWRLAVVRTLSVSGVVIGTPIYIICTARRDGALLAATCSLAQLIVSALVLAPMLPIEPLRLRSLLRGWHLLWGAHNVRLHGVNVNTQLVARVDQATLAAVSSPGILGVYAVATNVAETVGYFPTAFRPLLVRGSASDPFSLRRMLAPILFVVASVVALMAGSGPLIHVLFGRQYQSAVPAAHVLIPAAGIFAIARMIQAAGLRSPAKRGVLTLAAISSAIVEAAAVAVLGPRGAVAAGLGCLLAYTVFAVLTLFACARPVGKRSPAVVRPVSSQARWLSFFAKSGVDLK